MSLGKRLQAIRMRRGYTQGQTAKQCHMCKASISQWENDERPIHADSLLILADFYNVSTDWLLGRTDVKEIAGCTKKS